MKSPNKLLCYILLIFLSNTGIAQIGGLDNFEFLKLSPSARATALGGSVISVSDGDIGLAWLNPAIMDSTFNRQVSFNHNFHFAGISNGQVNYGHHLSSSNISLIGGIQYANYGTFDLTDDIGNVQGTFEARDVAVGIGAAKRLNERIQAGMLLKFASSNYESYTASAILTDFGLFYSKPGSNSQIGIILKNIGYQLSQFNVEERSVPFDFQFAYSTRLKYLPFRITVLAQEMDQWEIRYDDPDRQENTNLFGETSESSGFSKAIDNLFRHLVFSGEFLLGKSEAVRLRFAYNHLLNKELSVSSFRSFGGFSFGIGINTRRFKLDLGRSSYHIAGGVTHLGFSINLGSFFNKV